jgi:hypothetical protein
VRVRFAWHFDTKYTVSPSILNNTISLLNKDLLRFHLLKLLNSLLGLFKLLTFICRHCEIVFSSFPTIEALYSFLGFLCAIVESTEFLTFLVEGDVVDGALAAEGGHVVPSQKTGGLLTLLIYIGFLNLFGS